MEQDTGKLPRSWRRLLRLDHLLVERLSRQLIGSGLVKVTSWHHSERESLALVLGILPT